MSSKVKARIVRKDPAGREVLWVTTDKCPSKIPESARRRCQWNYKSESDAKKAVRKVEEICNE